MSDWIALTQVAAKGVPGRTVSLRGGERLSHERFCQDVARWQASLQAVAGERIALYCEDSYTFACALFGSWHAGKVPVLPGDALPATLDHLLSQVDACAGDLPGGLQAAAAPAPAPAPLDFEATRVVIYTSGSSGRPLDPEV